MSTISSIRDITSIINNPFASKCTARLFTFVYITYECSSVVALVYLWHYILAGFAREKSQTAEIVGFFIVTQHQC